MIKWLRPISMMIMMSIENPNWFTGVVDDYKILNKHRRSLWPSNEVCHQEDLWDSIQTTANINFYLTFILIWINVYSGFFCLHYIYVLFSSYQLSYVFQYFQDNFKEIFLHFADLIKFTFHHLIFVSRSSFNLGQENTFVSNISLIKLVTEKSLNSLNN